MQSKMSPVSGTLTRDALVALAGSVRMLDLVQVTTGGNRRVLVGLDQVQMIFPHATNTDSSIAINDMSGGGSSGQSIQVRSTVAQIREALGSAVVRPDSG